MLNPLGDALRACLFIKDATTFLNVLLSFLFFFFNENIII